MTAELTDHARRNRAYWDELAEKFEGPGRRLWATDEPEWGIWGVSDEQVGLLDHLGDLGGRDVLELGCGTAYWSAWLARRGACPVGIDNSPAQLETAVTLQREHGLHFPLHLGTAEALPFADNSFDIAFSEYGAAIWCDPYLWIPEAARVLRPGGLLVAFGNSVQLMLSMPESGAAATERLERPLFGMHRFEWPDDTSVEFHISHGARIDLLRAVGLTVERLIEVQPPAGAQSEYGGYVTPDWARRWPCEELWIARKRLSTSRPTPEYSGCPPRFG